MSEQEKQEQPTEVVKSELPPKPERKCTEKQLAALAAGRAKNKRFKPKEAPKENA